jgi:hypothetical protein
MHRNAFYPYLDTELPGEVDRVAALGPGSEVEVTTALRDGASVQELLLVRRLGEDDEELLG